MQQSPSASAPASTSTRVPHSSTSRLEAAASSYVEDEADIRMYDAISDGASVAGADYHYASSPTARGPASSSPTSECVSAQLHTPHVSDASPLVSSPTRQRSRQASSDMDAPTEYSSSPDDAALHTVTDRRRVPVSSPAPATQIVFRAAATPSGSLSDEPTNLPRVRSKDATLPSAADSVVLESFASLKFATMPGTANTSFLHRSTNDGSADRRRAAGEHSVRMEDVRAADADDSAEEDGVIIPVEADRLPAAATVARRWHSLGVAARTPHKPSEQRTPPPPSPSRQRRGRHRLIFESYTLLLKDVSLTVAPIRCIPRYQRRCLLSDVSAFIPAGAITCVLSLTQGNASAVLSTLAGVERNATGLILANGVSTSTQAFHTCTAYISSVHGIDSEATVKENVLFSVRLRIAMRGGEREERRRVEMAAHATLLTRYMDQPAKGLSRSQLYQLAVAMELVRDPAVVLLDAPFQYFSLADMQTFLEMLRNLMSWSGTCGDSAAAARGTGTYEAPGAAAGSEHPLSNATTPPGHSPHTPSEFHRQRVIVISTTDMPLPLYNVISDLVLISRHGQMLYSGEVSGIENFFALSMGVPNVRGEMIADLLVQLEGTGTTDDMAHRFTTSAAHQELRRKLAAHEAAIAGSSSVPGSPTAPTYSPFITTTPPRGTAGRPTKEPRTAPEAHRPSDSASAELPATVPKRVTAVHVDAKLEEPPHTPTGQAAAPSPDVAHSHDGAVGNTSTLTEIPASRMAPNAAPGYSEQLRLLTVFTLRKHFFTRAFVLPWATLLVSSVLAFLFISLAGQGPGNSIQNIAGLIFFILSCCIHVNTVFLDSELDEFSTFVHQRNNSYFTVDQYVVTTILRLIVPRLLLALLGATASFIMLDVTAAPLVATMALTSLAHAELQLLAVYWLPTASWTGYLWQAQYWYYGYCVVFSGYILNVRVTPRFFQATSLLRIGYGGLYSSVLKRVKFFCPDGSSSSSIEPLADSVAEHFTGMHGWQYYVDGKLLPCFTGASYAVELGFTNDSWGRSVIALTVASLGLFLLVSVSMYVTWLPRRM